MLTKNFALLGVSTLLALTTCEVACRVFHSPIDREMSTFKAIRDVAYVADTELGWVPRPSFRGEHRLPHDQVSTFSTNSLGLRGHEITAHARADLQRIVVAGDSFAWGWGVNDGDTFAHQLTIGRADREVINLGVINYNVLQETEYFERIGARFEPDVVLLAFCENDVVGATYDFLAPQIARPRTANDEMHGLRRVKQAVAEHSATYRLANDLVTSNRGLMRLAVEVGLKDGLDGYGELDYNLRPFLKEYPQELEIQWNTAMSQVLELKSIADAHGSRFIVAVIPALQSVDRRALDASLATSTYRIVEFDLDRPYAALARFARQHEIEFVDPTPAFRAARLRGEELYLIGDMHFNAEGHRLFAETISEYLDDSVES